MSLKFEDIKVGDVLDTPYDKHLTVLFKSDEILVFQYQNGREICCHNENLVELTYHQPKPTKESILEELGGDKWRPPHKPLCFKDLHTLEGVIQKIQEQLSKEKIKILFNWGD